MTKWEYLESSCRQKNLNQLGEEGWELCAVIPHVSTGMTTYITYYFKRPKETKDD